MSMMFRSVSFRYDGAAAPLFERLTAHFIEGWTAVVGANGAGKTTLLKLATGQLRPESGAAQVPGEAIYCPQRTDDLPELFDSLIEATDGHAREIKGRLGIEEDWRRRWDTLSHGERKRAQIGVMLWRRPAVLAVDEPTNHLDAEARRLLAAALRSFQGIGLLVSHDRELMDTLCCQCLFLDPPDATMRPGGYTEAAEQRNRDEEYARKRRDLAKDECAKLRRTVGQRRDAANQADRKRSKRGLAKGEHDAKDRIDKARVTSKDATAGRLMRQLEGRLEQAEGRLAEIRIKKTYDMGIWLPGSQSKRDTLFRRPAGVLSLGGDRVLLHPDLVMYPEDRIALTGPNGAGKSTLIRQIARDLPIPQEQVTYLPQEIDLRSSQDILNRARRLPKDKLGQMMTVVSCLGSRPERLLESDEPSPGEVRKLLIAMGIANRPHLIIMDEPTNHLDLPSIECLEDALDGCPCGLLLVSHDERFLQRLARTRWRISREAGSNTAFVLDTAR